MKSKKADRSARSPLSLTEVLQALGDPIRLDIVRQLKETDEKTCGTFGIDKPKSTMSHHFGVLRKSGVLGFEKRGANLVNYIDWQRLDSNFPGLLESILRGASVVQGREGRTKLPRSSNSDD